ncbi:MAG: AraC family transcriptional regulator [Ruminococcaceae bacterium]|nr:AraC family transcriptional regulator [Oscillospiraceae bacterium]
MVLDLDKPVNVKMFGKVTQPKGFWHDQKDQNQKLQSISSNLLLYVTRGAFNIRIGDNIYSVSEGDVVIIPSKTKYQPRESDGCSYYFVHFSATTLENTLPSNIDQSLLRFQGIADNQNGYAYNYYGKAYSSIISLPIHFKQNSFKSYYPLQNVFERATKLNIWRNHYEKLLLDNITRELLILISTELTTQQTSNNTLQKILHYINNHYTEPLTLTSIAETFGFSTSYITKLFRNFLGKGTVDYINDLRLTAACEYLISSNHTIGEISNKIGFPNQYYFDRLFKRKYGVTPKEFRKSNNNRNF